MLPADWTLVVAASSPHPAIEQWLANKTGVEAKYVAELPRRLELAARNRDLEFDPDQVLIDCLLGKGLLRKSQLPNVAALRRLTTDSASRFLLLQRTVSEEQLHQTFLEICYLPPAQPWKIEDVKRLTPILPPRFAAEHACYALEQTNTQIRLGLAQMPSAAAVRTLYNRLPGYSLAFQALTYADALELKVLLR